MFGQGNQEIKLLSLRLIKAWRTVVMSGWTSHHIPRLASTEDKKVNETPNLNQLQLLVVPHFNYPRFY